MCNFTSGRTFRLLKTRAILTVIPIGSFLKSPIMSYRDFPFLYFVLATILILYYDERFTLVLFSVF